RLLGVGRAQDLEHAVETLLTHDVAHPHEVAVVRRDLDRQVPLGYLEHQVEPVFTLDGASLHLLDQRRTMMRVHDSLAYLENHMLCAPFATSTIPRGHGRPEPVSRRLRRSEAM